MPRFILPRLLELFPDVSEAGMCPRSLWHCPFDAKSPKHISCLAFGTAQLGKVFRSLYQSVVVELQTGNWAGIMFYQCWRADRRDLLWRPRGCWPSDAHKQRRMQHKPVVCLVFIALCHRLSDGVFLPLSANTNANVTQLAGVRVWRWLCSPDQ